MLLHSALIPDRQWTYCDLSDRQPETYGMDGVTKPAGRTSAQGVVLG